MDKKEETFQYTYSAKQQQEVKTIRAKYAPPEENKLEQLRRLDQSVQIPGTIASLALGVIATLIFGVGLCCVMVWENVFVLGIIVGVIGMAGMALAYPLFAHITKKQREKLAPQILKLTDELMR